MVGQIPYQPCIDRAEEKVAVDRGGARTVYVVEQPGQLGRREIGVKNEPGPRREQGFMAVVPQTGAQIRRTPVLPDNRVVNCRAGVPVPDDRRFALVRDADCGNFRGGKTGVPQGGVHRLYGRSP